MCVRKAMLRALWAAVVVLGCVRGASGAGDPALAREQIRETSDRILALFRDRELIKPENNERFLDAMRSLLDERFDWQSISRWVLARNRPLFNDEQMEEFSRVFGDYVVLHYLTQVEHHIVSEDPANADRIGIEILDGILRTDGSLTLDVVFTPAEGAPVKTGYTLVYDETLTAWRVRNFIVEGVSLVRNWRTELAPLRSREKIMDVLESKVRALREKRGAK
ncbi:MAG: ABC transporter substrate-binding protein [Lentisphaeria bacterium]|nr:ABC transporter substrate-binding protein [Lentisphaeria bacterium]